MPSIIETARWAAAQRVRESERRDHLFSDPLAGALAGEEGMVALDLSQKYNPRHEETANYISIRIRFFDDVAKRFSEDGGRQIVVLAAGMDARAYRLAWPDGTNLYELDYPELFTIKEEILRRAGVTPKCTRVTLGTDLRQDWARLLTNAAFDPSQQSLWLIEGLFYYLDEPAVNHVLTEVSKLAAPGSVLITDLVSLSFLTSPWMQPALKAMEERGMAWRFGTDDPAGLFGAHGWQAEVKQPDEEGTKYDPQRFPAIGSGHRESFSGFFVVARRT
jgi:methyltransferase (TIGR00027 family)